MNLGIPQALTSPGRIYRGWWIVALAFYSQLITVAASVGAQAFGMSYPLSLTQREVDEETLRKAVKAIDEMIMLGVAEGDGIRFIDYLQSTNRVVAAPPKNSLYPLSKSACGKLVLGHRPDLCAGIRDRCLLEEIAQARRTGLAWNHAETDPGIDAVAMWAGKPSVETPLIAIIWPSYRFTPAKAAKATKGVKAVKPAKQVKAVKAPTAVKLPKGATPVPGQPTQYDMPTPKRSSLRGPLSPTERLAKMLQEDGPAIIAMGKREEGPEGCLEIEEVTEQKVA